MNELGEYLKVINDNIFIVIVLMSVIIVGVMITINIGKWLIKMFKKYCL
jgi:hypothetical protein